MWHKKIIIILVIFSHPRLQLVCQIYHSFRITHFSLQLHNILFPLSPSLKLIVSTLLERRKPVSYYAKSRMILIKFQPNPKSHSVPLPEFTIISKLSRTDHMSTLISSWKFIHEFEVINSIWLKEITSQPKCTFTSLMTTNRHTCIRII